MGLCWLKKGDILAALVCEVGQVKHFSSSLDFIASQYFAITNSQTSVLDNRLLFYGEIQ